MRKLFLSIAFQLSLSFVFGQHYVFNDHDTTSGIHFLKGKERLSFFYRTNQHDDRHSLYRMESLDSNLQVTDTASFRIPGNSRELANGENYLYSYYLFRTVMGGRYFFVILVYDKSESGFHSFVKTNEEFDKLVNSKVNLGECRVLVVGTRGSDAAKLVMQPWERRDSRNRMGPLLTFSLADGKLLSSAKTEGRPVARAIVNGAIVTITSDDQAPLVFHSTDLATGVDLKSVSIVPEGKRRTLSSFAVRDNYVFITGMQADKSDMLYKNSLFYMTAIDYAGRVAFDKVDKIDRLPDSRLHILESTRNANDELILIGESYHRNYTKKVASEVVGNTMGAFGVSDIVTQPVGRLSGVKYIVESIVTVRLDANGMVKAFHSFPVPPRKSFSRIYASRPEVFLRNNDEVQRYDVNNEDQPPQPYMKDVDPKMFIIAWKGRLLGYKKLPKSGAMLSVIHIR